MVGRIPEEQGLKVWRADKLGEAVDVVRPVAIKSAEPGDVMEMRVLDIRMDVSYSWHTFFPGGTWESEQAGW